MGFVLSYDLKCLCCHSVHNFLHSDFYIKCVGIWNSPPYQISSASVKWFIICYTTEKLYVQFVHLVHSILTWMICNRSYILYFFISLCIVQQFIVLYLVLCLSHVKTFLGICHTHLSWNCVFSSHWICHTIRGYHDDILIPSPFYSQ